MNDKWFAVKLNPAWFSLITSECCGSLRFSYITVRNEQQILKHYIERACFESVILMKYFIFQAD